LFGSCIIYFLNKGVPKFKRKFRRQRAKVDIQEVGCGGTDWIELAKDRDRWRELVNAIMNLRAP
jgi:hypothetical protein